jgi:hypothetical protein
MIFKMVRNFAYNINVFGSADLQSGEFQENMPICNC